MGFRGFKAHGWCEGNVEEEIALVRTLGERVNGRMALMLDPASELRTFNAALRVGRAYDEQASTWYEDPMRDCGTSAHAHRKLRQMMRTPLLLTEHVRELAPKADMACEEATDFLRADPEYDLGITGVTKIAALAEGLGMDVEIHGCGPAHRHCMGAIRNTNYYELALVHPLCSNPIPSAYSCGHSDQLDAVATDGTVGVPRGPGLGVNYDWDFINARRESVSIFQVRVGETTTNGSPVTT